MPKKTANVRDLVMSRLKRLAQIEDDKPGSVKDTTMLRAFLKAVG